MLVIVLYIQKNQQEVDYAHELGADVKKSGLFVHPIIFLEGKNDQGE